MELLFFFQLRHFSTVRMTARTVRGEVRSNGEAQCAHARFDSQSPRASVPFEPTVALEPIRRSGPRERPKVREVPLLPHSFVRQIGLAPMLRAARQRQRVGRSHAGQYRAHELRRQLVEILALRAGLHLRTTMIPQARVPEQASR